MQVGAIARAVGMNEVLSKEILEALAERRWWERRVACDRRKSKRWRRCRLALGVGWHFFVRIVADGANGV